MKKLYFVRHGLSQSNALKTFAGQTDVALLDEGRDHARITGVKLKQQKLRIDLIISSPLKRAMETAQIIASEIGYPLEDIVQNELFLERSYGKLEGANYKNYFSDQSYKDIDDIEGAEKVQALQNRSAAALRYLQSRSEDSILVVGHGAFGRALRRVIQGVPYTDEFTGPLKMIQNAEVVELV